MSFERFFAVSATIVLAVVGGPVPRRVNPHKNIVTRAAGEDLVQQESLTVELKNDFKRPNDINSPKLNNAKDDANTILLRTENVKRNVNKDNNVKNISTDKSVDENITENRETNLQIPFESITELTTSNTSKVLNVPAITDQPKETNISKNEDIVTNTNAVNFLPTTEDMNQSEQTSTISESEPTTDVIQTIALENKTPLLETTTQVSSSEITSETMEMSTDSVTAPSGKKYTIIERKRVFTTTDGPITSTDFTTDFLEISSTISEGVATVTDKVEVMVKSETTQGRISLQDAMTSDIPSLEKLKTDLLSFPKFTTKSDFETSTPLMSTEENITVMDAPVTSTFSPLIDSESPNTVSSKRAGYLDLSAKVTDAEELIGLKPNGTEMLQGPFDAETPEIQDETPEDKIEIRVESQSQLTEDAIKEELLKEEMLNDNEDNAKRHPDEEQQIQIDTPTAVNTYTISTTQFNDAGVLPTNLAPEDNLSVKPINSDKAKNTILYPVNPNYKPLKKIEVQPAKPFVRDPDDNSWRNESLSSLGIVFKPKNSTKPFTQVLKNKTETEWNNISEKDRKNEVPDLRVRLDQMAQKRKSKKKKIDSLGNVFYTDYEENSSSEENTSTTQAEDPSVSTISTTDVSFITGITIVTPIQTTPVSSTNSETTDTPSLTTTAPPTQNTETTLTPNKELTTVTTKVTTVKPPKLFNLFDYYETNDEDDIEDYLNMAKIDLKKFTPPLQTTFSPFTSPPLPILYSNPMPRYMPERKGTIQYFPPRTTTRPRKNKHKNVQHKINPLTLTEPPKNDLPIYYHKLTTTPYTTDGMYYTSSPDMSRLKDEHESDPKNFDRNAYLTTPPLNTVPPDDNFGVISNDEGFNRANYIIKQYKDYMNEAHDNANKHGEYVAYTQPPTQGGTISELIKTTTVKDNMRMDEEYDYESQFRKDVLERFVANFNENAKRFKSDFPLLYNNSIVHGSNYHEKDVALSRAYFRRPYSNQGDYKPIRLHEQPYDPNCENVTVELSPAYELHYYVPEQEEKQEIEPKPITLPIPYRL
ncbi:uncharacterized protein [Epargyreus clarus]|uniref:uncharacterized protein isoform X1 n=1 Tax=Epargyreus clarus TaxID=520877 RepID=UPI003C30640A